MTAETKPIAAVFALIGLYLHVERDFTGLQVQQVHMQLGRQTHQWPPITFPSHRGDVTAADVLTVPEGEERDRAISDWCRSVWQAYQPNRQTIVHLLQQHNVF